MPSSQFREMKEQDLIYRRNQLEDESAEQYHMELYKLAENCNYIWWYENWNDLWQTGSRYKRHCSITAPTTWCWFDSGNSLEKISQRQAIEEQQQVLRETNGDSKTLQTLVVQPCQEYTAKKGRRYCKPVYIGNRRAKTKPYTHYGIGVHPRDKMQPVIDATK